MKTEVKIALIGSTATIAATLITGFFSVFANNSDRNEVEVPSRSLKSGTVTVFTADKQQERSGFNFSGSNLVGWHSGKADILVAKSTHQNLHFFLQHEEGPSGVYSGAEADRNARAGISEVVASNLDDISMCSTNSSNYQYHWFKPVNNSFYCVRARDGQHYAKIHVTQISEDGITFDWVFQSENTSQFK